MNIPKNISIYTTALTFILAVKCLFIKVSDDGFGIGRKLIYRIGIILGCFQVCLTIASLTMKHKNAMIILGILSIIVAVFYYLKFIVHITGIMP